MGSTSRGIRWHDGAQLSFFRLLAAKEFDTRGSPVSHFRA